MPAIDFSNVKGLEPIPVGAYTASITSAERKTSQAGNEMINLQWKVSGGKYDGRIVFDSMVFTEKTLWRVKAALIALGYSKTFSGEVDPDQLVGKTATILVEIEVGRGTDQETGEPYPDRNRVRRIKPLQPVVAAPAAAVARPASAKK